MPFYLLKIANSLTIVKAADKAEALQKFLVLTSMSKKERREQMPGYDPHPGTHAEHNLLGGEQPTPYTEKNFRTRGGVITPLKDGFATSHSGWEDE